MTGDDGRLAGHHGSVIGDVAVGLTSLLMQGERVNYGTHWRGMSA